jgi:hypothetical protein
MYILHNIGFNSQNKYPWTKEIHMIKTMGTFVYAWRIINKLFGKPKHLFSLEVWKVICEKWPRCVICHIGCKFSRIIRSLCPPQQQFNFIKSMTNWTTLQVLSIQHRLFESTNIIIECRCVQTTLWLFSHDIRVMHMLPNCIHKLHYKASMFSVSNINWNYT